MNKCLLSIVMFVSTVSFISCHKKYTCKCTTYQKGTSNIVDEQEVSFRGKVNIQEWENGCKSTATAIDSTNNNSTNTNCSIN